MAHQLFPEWISKAETAMTDETIKKRIQSVDSLARVVGKETSLGLVRLFLGKPIDNEVAQTIRAEFTKHDVQFKAHDNDFEMQIMAGGTLVEMMQVVKNDASLIAALALNCNLFLFDNASCIPQMSQICNAYLRERAITVRVLPTIAIGKQLVAGMNKSLTDLKATYALSSVDGEEVNKQVLERQGLLDLLTNIVSSVKGVEDNHKQILKSQSILEEEADILWWVFGQQLPPEHNDISKDNASIPLLSALSLASLTKLLPAPISAESVLLRFNASYGVAVTETCDITRAVNACSRETKQKINKEYQVSQVIDICPVLSALSVSLSTDGEEDWLPAYRKIISPAPPEMAAQELSQQVYKEFLLSRAVGTSSIQG